MHFNPEKVRLISIVSVISLIGLVSIQLYLFANTVELEKQVFARSVRTAMQLVVRRLELSETMRNVTTGRSVIVQRQTLMRRSPPTAQVDSLLPDPGAVTRKRMMVEQVLDRMIFQERKPVDVRITPARMDSLIKTSLHDVGIRLDYAYGITRPEHRVFHFIQPEQYANHLSTSGYRTRLFPNDILLNDTGLVLYFPDETVFLLKQIGPMLGVTLLLSGVLVCCFLITLRTAVNQRRLYDRLVNYINNMTHEFKTPISTIALAAESLNKPNTVNDPERMHLYSNIIEEENQRMQQQVDNILQITSLEEGRITLKYELIDVHVLLRKTIKSFSLQAEEKGGEIISRFEAVNSHVNADRMHMEQIFRNLLDNALKYSPAAPDISVQTDEIDARLRIRVIDKGSGIPSSSLPMVFDKYFRVPKGNRHDVKGFGIGLSYVKMMVEAHGAEIHVDSVEDEGTIVTIIWPLNEEEKGLV